MLYVICYMLYEIYYVYKVIKPYQFFKKIIYKYFKNVFIPIHVMTYANWSAYNYIFEYFFYF